MFEHAHVKKMQRDQLSHQKSRRCFPHLVGASLFCHLHGNLVFPGKAGHKAAGLWFSWPCRHAFRPSSRNHETPAPTWNVTHRLSLAHPTDRKWAIACNHHGIAHLWEIPGYLWVIIQLRCTSKKKSFQIGFCCWQSILSALVAPILRQAA